MKARGFYGIFSSRGRHRASSLRFGLLIAGTPMSAIASELASTGIDACGHAGQADKLLNVATAGIVILSLAIASYQRTTGQRRIAEITPLVVSGLLVGALAQLGRVLISVSPLKCDVDAALASALPWL